MQEREWWFVKDGNRYGPHTIDDLKPKLIAGEISASTRVWHKGMDSWSKMADLDELNATLKECPPPISEDEPETNIALPGFGSPTSNQLTTPLNPAGPWSRFFARGCDLLVFNFMGWFMIGFIFPEIVESQIFENLFFVNFISLPLALLIEVPVLALTGGTLGKMFFGISLRRQDGKKLTTGEVFHRNLSLWINGFCLGIPIINLFFLAKNYKIAKAGNRCPWDETFSHNVRQASIGPFRWSAGFVCYLLVIFGMLALASIDDISDPVSKTTSSKLLSEKWVNPITNEAATLYDEWSYKPEETQDNSETFWFQNKESIVILGHETYEGIDLGTYYEALQANKNFGVLEGKKVEIDDKGMRYLILSHIMESEGQVMRVDVKVWQTAPDNYWRSIILSDIGNERELSEARLMAEALEKTSLLEVSEWK
jgi:uncharacterized RDD family membrane protein YckC